MRALLGDSYAQLMLHIATIVIAAAVLSITLLSQAKQHLRARAGEAVAQAAAAAGQQAGTLLFERYADIHMLGRAFQAKTQDIEYLTRYLHWMQQSYGVYRWLGVTNAAGRVIASTDSWALGMQRQGASWFETAIRERGPIFDGIRARPEASEGRALAFAAPIFDEHGGVQGVVASVVSLHVFDDLTTATEAPVRAALALASRFEYLVVTETGEPIAGSFPRETPPPDVTSWSSFQHAAREGEPGFVEELPSGWSQPALTGYARTRGSPLYLDPRWVVLVQLPTAAALAPLGELQKWLAIIVTVGLVPSLALAFVLTRRLRLESRKLKEREAQLESAHAGLEHQVAERTRELRMSQARLTLAQTVTKSGIWDWDVKTNHAVWSEGVCQVFGREVREGAVSWDIWQQAVHPMDRQAAADRVLMALATSENYEDEFRIVKGADEVRWLKSQARIFRDEHGRPTRMLGIVLDVTERKQHEQELHNQQQQLLQAAKLASIGELAAGIAHELNNPLNNIGLFVGNAEERLPPDHPAATNLKAAREQVRRAASIIQQLRTFARRSPPAHKPISLHAVLQSSLSLLREQLRLASIEVELELVTGDPLVLGDRVQLEQVLLNLMMNAKDAMKGSQVRRLSLGTRTHSHLVEVWVRDTGCGIPSEMRNKIFDPFFTTKQVGEGTGLGLSISYGILKEHAGSIAVTSEVGQGTTFTVSLPLLGEAAKQLSLGSTDTTA